MYLKFVLLRTQLFALLALILAMPASAQDKLHKRNSVTAEQFSGARKPLSQSRYGNNIISASPMLLTERGAGMGLNYERVIDGNRNFISFYMPAAFVFGFNNGDYEYYYYGQNKKREYSWYVMPGLKFYPAGGRGVVKYAVGPNLVLRQTHRTQTYIPPQHVTVPFYYPSFTGEREFTIGMMVNNSLNINPTKHLHMGLDLGLGFSYASSNSDIAGVRYDSGDPEPLVQIGFKIGYRF